SAFDPKRTFRNQRSMSAIGGKEDIATERFTFAAYHTADVASPGRGLSGQPPPPIPQLSPREGALSRLVGQRPALGHCPPPVSLVLHILERGFQIGHLLLGPFCP
ncbi:MAG: hypothetical protein WBV43_02880, partial [Pseudolabrys sp.]